MRAPCPHDEARKALLPLGSHSSSHSSLPPVPKKKPSIDESAPTSRLDSLPVFIARLHHAFPAFIEHIGRDTQVAAWMKPGMGAVLLALSEQDDCRVRDLALLLHLRNATLTGLLDRLESLGLARREPCSLDKRVLRVKLTAKGRQLLPVLDEFHNHGTQTMETGFSTQELTMLKSLLGRVLDNMRAQEPERSSTMSKRSKAGTKTAKTK